MKSYTQSSFKKITIITVTGMMLHSIQIHAQDENLRSVDSEIASLGGSGVDGQQTDASYIYADFVSLGQTSGDVSNINARFTAVDSAIDTLPTNTELSSALNAQTLALQGATTTNTLTTLAGASFNTTTDSLEAISTAIAAISGGSTDLTPIEGPGFATANNSLAALTGTGTGTGKSGSTNTFNPATQSLADMTGASFATSTDSLHKISNNQISVPFATAASLSTTNSTVNTINTNVNTANTNVNTANNSLATIITLINNTNYGSVVGAAANPALTTAIVASGDQTAVNTYNTNISQALNLANQAASFPDLNMTNQAINALATAITSLINVGSITSPYNKANVQLGLIQLNTALKVLQKIQS